MMGYRYEDYESVSLVSLYSLKSRLADLLRLS